MTFCRFFNSTGLFVEIADKGFCLANRKAFVFNFFINIKLMIHRIHIDQGAGMTRAFIRDELFKPFVSTKEGGFGLGAFEALQLAQAMGGTIEVASEPGKGSNFTLWLPLADTRPGGAIDERIKKVAGQ